MKTCRYCDNELPSNRCVCDSCRAFGYEARLEYVNSQQKLAQTRNKNQRNWSVESLLEHVGYCPTSVPQSGGIMTTAEKVENRLETIKNEDRLKNRTMGNIALFRKEKKMGNILDGKSLPTDIEMLIKDHGWTLESTAIANNAIVYRLRKGKEVWLVSRHKEA